MKTGVTGVEIKKWGINPKMGVNTNMSLDG
jgi:hypothetical protein